MNGYERWRDAEADGRDEDADRALRTLFHSLAIDAPPVSSGFTERTLAAVASAAARDARRARRTKVAAVSGTIAGGSVAAYFGTGWAISLVTNALVGFLNLIVAGVVHGAATIEAGAGFWGVLTSLGRAAGAFVADPTVTSVILAIQAIAIAALVALHRLLGTDVESFE